MPQQPTLTDPITQAELRAFFAADAAVVVQIAEPSDGSPEVAWGDTFIFARDPDGAPAKMPFATLITKDYPGFDESSQLTPRGLFRLNLDLGKDRFTALLGFPPKASESHHAAIDFTARDTFSPHPVYGAWGWVSIVAPSAAARPQVLALLQHARDRATHASSTS